MKFFLVFIFFLSVNIGAANASMDSWCQFKINDDTCSNIQFESGISRKADSKFVIYFTKKIKKEFQVIQLDKDPEIKLWMVMKGGHGHGSEIVKIKKVQNKYQISNVWFLMLGQWDIKISGVYKGERFNASQPICIRKDSKKSALGACK